jgi:hypothetical protein
LDIKSKLGTVLIYITLISLLERTGINLKIYCLISLSVLKMPDKLQEYSRIYYSETPLPNSMLRGFNIKPSTFIYSDPLNQ